MKVLVFGAGAIGLYFAGRLADAGHDVTLKGRASTVAALAGSTLGVLKGATITEVSGIEVVDDVGEDRRFDLVLVATKAWQVAEAAREIAAVVDADTRVVTTQNGVDAPERLAASLPRGQVLAATVVVIANRRDARLVEVLGAEARVTVGSLERPAPEARDSAVVEALTLAGMDAQWTGNVRGALWKKLALISSYGGVGALAGATVGQTRSIPLTRDLVEDAMREVFAVGNAEGAGLGDDDLADILATYETGFADGTTASMQRDLAEGRPSELADQNGAVVAHAAAPGVPVPINRTIYASQLPRESMASGEAVSWPGPRSE